MNTLTKCGRIASSITGLKVEAHGVAVVIRHDERDDIKVHATEPNDWSVDDDGTIRQRNAAEALGGAIERSTLKTAAGATVDSVIVKGDLAVIDGKVFVNGHKISPDSESGARSRDGRDELYLVVPEAFLGGLEITFSAGTSVDIDTWNGGDVSLTGSAGSTVYAGHLRDLSSFVLNGRGLGKVDIESMRTQSFRATKQGVGDLNIGALVTDSFELNQTGLGKTKIGSVHTSTGSLDQRGSGDVDISELSADSFEMKQGGGGSTAIGDIETQSFVAAKEGGANLSIGKLVTDSLQVSQVGMGNTCINDGSAESGSASTEGAGSITLRGRFKNIMKRNNGVGRVEIQDPV